MFIRHVFLKKFQSLSCLYVKGCVFNDKISIRTVSSVVQPKGKLPSSENGTSAEKKPSSRGRREGKPPSSKSKKSKSTKKKPALPRAPYNREIVNKIFNILSFSTWDDAKGQLRGLSIKWSSYIITRVLMTHPPMEKAWLFFNWARKLEGFKHDQYTYTTMLDVLGGARRISSMMFVFQEMRNNGIAIDMVTYTTLMHWLASDGDFDGATTCWEEMRHMDRDGLTIVSYTVYLRILLDHNREKEATDLYKEMLEVGLTPNAYTYTVLMVHMANSGKFDKVMEIFIGMQDALVLPDKTTCNTLIEKCSEAGKTSEMTKILMYMKANSLVLRYKVYVKAMNAFSNAGESDGLLRQVNPHTFPESFSQPKVKKPTLDETIILSLLEKKNFDDIDHLLSNATNGSMQLDSKLISTIIEVNAGSERQSGAVVAFDYSVSNGISINSSAYRALIGMFVRKNLSRKVVEIVEKMIQEGLSLGTQLSTLLIYRLGCAREPVAAATVFNVLPAKQKNTATYTALIGAYFTSGNPDDAIQTFETMKAQGIKVALGTKCILLAGLEKSGRDKQLVSYRKEINSLQAESISQVTSEEEMICNLLFSGKLLV